MKLRNLFILFSSMTFAACAYADIYKRVDSDGHVTYSSTPFKGAKKLHLEPLPTMLPPGKGASGEERSSDFRVNSETQSRRDNTRRKILEDELADEQKALDDARAKLKEGQDNPEVYHTASGQTFRNVAKYDEKVKALQDDVDAHQKNVDALNTELSNLKD